MTQSRIRVVLVFRSREKAGKSIEGLFDKFILEPQSDIEFIGWNYNPKKNLLMNITSLRRQKADVWHITGDINYMVLALWGKRTILTIHDLGRYRTLRGLKKWVYRKLWIQWPLKMADVVTVVSLFTKEQIQKVVKLKYCSKINVIYNGYNPVYRGTNESFNTLQPRILQIGTAVHKNLDTVIAALTGTQCMLTIIGPLNMSQRQALQGSGVSYRNYQNLSAEELRQQYSQTDIVVFASLHEGFGMPVIEAQAMGRPLITSRLASLPEVAGTGAHFLDNPLDVDELRHSIIKIIEDYSYRDRLIEEGYKNVLRFSWPNMKAAYLELYKSIMTT